MWKRVSPLQYIEDDLRRQVERLKRSVAPDQLQESWFGSSTEAFEKKHNIQGIAGKYTVPPDFDWGITPGSVTRKDAVQQLAHLVRQGRGDKRYEILLAKHASPVLEAQRERWAVLCKANPELTGIALPSGSLAEQVCAYGNLLAGVWFRFPVSDIAYFNSEAYQDRRNNPEKEHARRDKQDRVQQLMSECGVESAHLGWIPSPATLSKLEQHFMMRRMNRRINRRLDLLAGTTEIPDKQPHTTKVTVERRNIEVESDASPTRADAAEAPAPRRRR